MLTRVCIKCQTEKLVEAFIDESATCGLCLAKSEFISKIELPKTQRKIPTKTKKLTINTYMKLKKVNRLFSLSKKDVVLIFMDIIKSDTETDPLLSEYGNLSKEEISAGYKREELLDIIDNLTLEKFQQELEVKKTVIDILDILNYYGELKKPIVKKISPGELLRKSAPNYIKNQLPTWKSASIEEIYNVTNQHITSTKGDLREELLVYSCDLSEELFEKIPIKTASMSILESKESITFVVESIVLPYLEVLDKIEEYEGNVLFKPENNQTLSKELIKGVFSRDNKQCVICTKNKDLQIHYKIPVEFGGIHTIDNLVTGCKKCITALETLDLELAVNKCLNNFKQLL